MNLEIQSTRSSRFGGGSGGNVVAHQVSRPFYTRLLLVIFFTLALVRQGQGASGTVVVWGETRWDEGNIPSGLSNVVAIAAGGFNTLALKNDGNIYSWGRSDSGQTNLPAGLSNLVAIARNHSYCLGLKSDGTVIAWGSATNGQTEVPLTATNVVAIAAGQYHGLALRTDGTVVGWGGWGMDYNQASVPAGLTNIVAIAAGGFHSLALKGDGTVAAWGAPKSGYWPSGSPNYGQTNVPPGLSNVVAIAAGGYHSLALRKDGTVFAWGAGKNPPGPIYYDYNYSQSYVPPWLSNVVAIAAGNLFSLALRNDGTVMGWGYRISGGTSGPAGLQNVVAISGGWFHSVALVNDGPPLLARVPVSQTLYTGMDASFVALAVDREPLSYRWQFKGTNLPGITGTTLVITNLQLTDVGTYSVTVSNAAGIISASASLTVLKSAPTFLSQPQSQAAMLDSKTVLTVSAFGSWPLSYQWQLNGTDLPGATNVFLVVTNDQPGEFGPYRAIVGNAHGSVMSSNAFLRVSSLRSYLVAWGSETNGQINIPEDVKAEPLLAAACGAAHTIALKPDGTVSAWGNNSYGQTHVPRDLSNVTAVAAGAYHNLALRDNGTVVAWGSEPPDPYRPPPRPSLNYNPVDVPIGLTNVISIRAGLYHSIALQSNGTVRAWGDNRYGQTSVPAGLSNVVGICAGGDHSLALKGDGKVVAWGNNTYGQRAVPIGLSNVIEIAAGALHGLALKGDGTIVGWGDSRFGQTNTPAGLTNAIAIACGQFHNLALKPDATVDAWGLNNQGQATIPADLKDVVAIGAGYSNSLAITFGGAPHILRQPVSQTLYSGWPATFRATASGAAAPHYQWQFNGTDLAGATHAVLTVTDAQLADAGNYRVVVSNELGVAVSSEAILTVVVSPPIFVVQPVSQPFLLRSSVTLAASLTGSMPCFYQWQLNGTSLAGETNAILILTNAQASDIGSYTLVVNNEYGTGVSSNAVLTQATALVVAWGDNAYGQTNVPKSITNATALAAGNAHNLALRSDGTVVAWGSNSYGQTNIPVGLSNVIAIAAGANNNLALRSDGTVVAWGDNTFRQSNVPPGLSNVVAIDAGFTVSLALRGDGSVVPWGSYYSGTNAVPRGLSNVVAVAAGSSQSIAVLNDGSVIEWQGHTPYSPILLPVPRELTNAVAVAGLGADCLALRADSCVIAWGIENSYGQTNVPPGLTNVVAIDGGSSHSLALRMDGTVAAWGAGTNSASNPNLGQSRVPLALHNVIAISAGGSHSLALINDGSPVLSKSLTDQSVYSGMAALFKVTVLGTPAPTCQWQFNGANIEGETNSWLELTDARPIDSGDYTLVASNLYSTVSSTAHLTVRDSPPVIISQPLTQSFLARTTVELAAVGSGSWPLFYQWQFNGTDLPGATAARLILTNASPSFAGLYTVVANNAFGAVTSSNALLVATHSRLVAWGDNGYGQTDVPQVLEDVSALAVGAFHNLALTASGRVVAWGAGTTTNGGPYELGQSIVPEGPTNVISIAANGDRSLALQANDTLVTWGRNSGPTNTPANATNLVAIAAGTYHNLALRADGSVLAWGYNYYGQTNLPPSLGGVTAIAAGDGHNLALRNDGTVVAWGDNYYFQTNPPSDLSNVVAIAAGSAHNMALKSDGTVVAWGENNYKQCAVPEGLSHVVAIAAGAYLSLAIQENGEIIAWGDVEDGQANLPSDLPHPVALGGGWNHGIAIVSDGSPFLLQWPASQFLYTGASVKFCAPASGTAPLSYQWQRNGANLPGATASTFMITNLRLSDAGDYTVVITNIYGVSISTKASLVVTDSPPIVTVQPSTQAAWLGANATFAVTIAGSLPLSYQWQLNGTNILGATNDSLTINGILLRDCGDYGVTVSNAFGVVVSSSATLVPIKSQVVAWGDNTYGRTSAPPGLFNAAAISAGGYHNLALKDDGTLVAWGNNGAGQTNIPPGLADVAAIAAGRAHNLALRIDGTVVAWGANEFGQTNVPADLNNVVAIAAGQSHSLALKRDGTVRVWGSNNSGQTNVPPGLRNVVAIAGYGEHCLALKGDGTVVGWGNDLSGQAAIPSELTNASAVAAGGYFSLVIRSNGTVFAWGYNSDGETNVPPNLSDVTAITAGFYHALALTAEGRVIGWGLNNHGETNVPEGLTNALAIAAGIGHSLALVHSPAPYLKTPLIGQALFTGMAARLEVEPIGAEPFKYQWRFNGLNLEGATNSSFLIGDAQPHDAGLYSVLVSNPYGTIVANASISVTASAPLITLRPIGPFFLLRTAVELIADVTGSWPLICQWRFNGANIPGATNTWLTLTNARAEDAGDYTLLVSNAFGVTVSLNTELAAKKSLLVAWGDNSYGQTNVPAELADVIAVAAGDYHTVALKNNGTVAAWGCRLSDNPAAPDYGQSIVPFGLTNVVAISASALRSLALKDDGTIVSWGYDDEVGGFVPADATNLVAIAAGYTHNLALRADGRVFAWGNNVLGQCDLPRDLTEVRAIAASEHLNMALRSNGTVVAWGFSCCGQTNIPAGLSNVVAIAAGHAHCLALKADGTVVGWGDNSEGQTEVPSPLSSVVSIAAGPYSSQLLRRDGTFIVVGGDSWGRIFNPPTLVNTVALAAGAHHSVAIVGDGSPFLAKQPFNLAVYCGLNAAFGAVVLGEQPLNYQWQYEGTNLQGATNISLIIPDVQFADAGAYILVASNRFGNFTSSAALLTVLRSQPRFAEVRLVTDGTLRWRLKNLSGHGPIIIEASTNLVDWSAVLTNPPAIGTLEYFDAQYTNTPKRFYRAQEE